MSEACTTWMYAVCISEFSIHFNHKNVSYPETSPISDYRLEGTTKVSGGICHTLGECSLG